MNKFSMICGMGLFLVAATAATPRGASAADLVDCTIARAEGSFGSYLPPHAGDTIRLDLSDVPATGQLRFRSASSVHMSYIPSAQPWKDESTNSQLRWVAGALTLEVVRDYGTRLVVGINDSAEQDESSVLLSCER
jgi:hypothetical protein